ncbi:MAG: hypothetical protein LBQ63_00370 [Deltaproteobacteria bacterium]|nr:hypothetical protein [Deltaproteobacteria bacterium]
MTDRDLESVYRLVSKKGSSVTEPDSNDEAEEDEESESAAAGSSSGGGKIILLPWSKRDHRTLGLEAPGSAPVPLIDRAHKLMHLWKAGDVREVDRYIDACALRRNELFMQLLQALTELSANSERSLLESISNHLHAKGAMPVTRSVKLEV